MCVKIVCGIDFGIHFKYILSHRTEPSKASECTSSFTHCYRSASLLFRSHQQRRFAGRHSLVAVVIVVIVVDDVGVVASVSCDANHNGAISDVVVVLVRRLFVAIVAVRTEQLPTVDDDVAVVAQSMLRRGVVPRLDFGGAVHLEHQIGAGGHNGGQQEHVAPLLDGRLRKSEM